MSASDAAPLPRLGEVFFDVRGNSRSMRLSWYADTGVAVLSIWQGGMCTGTFRLAIADLPRMVETLQRGPDGQQPGWDGEAPGQAFGDAPDATAQVRPMAPMSGQMMQPAPGDFRDAGGYPGDPQPPDPRGGAPDYAADPAGPRTGVTEYPAAATGRRGGSGPYPAEAPPAPPQMPPPPAPEPAPGPGGYPGEPQPQDRRGGAPDYLADPLEALGRLGVPEGPPGAAQSPYQAGAPDYLTAPPPDQRPSPAEYPAAAEYPAEPRQDQRPSPADYLTGPPPDQRPGPAEYRAEPRQDQRPGPAEYRPELPPDQRPGPAEYRAELPPDQRPSSADYLTGPSGYPAGPPAQPAQPGHPGPGTGYLENLPAGPNADRAYGADFHPGNSPGSSYPGAGDSGTYPGAGDSGTYPRGTGHLGAYTGEPASDPYLVGDGPMDYQAEAPVSHYQGGSPGPRSNPRSNRRSAPRSGAGATSQGDPLGPSTADYPVHYGAALTDDMADEPPLESFPYQPRRGGR